MGVQEETPQFDGSRVNPWRTSLPTITPSHLPEPIYISPTKPTYHALLSKKKKLMELPTD